MTTMLEKAAASALEPFAAYEPFDPEWAGFTYAEVAELMPDAIARALGQSDRTA